MIISLLSEINELFSDFAEYQSSEHTTAKMREKFIDAGQKISLVNKITSLMQKSSETEKSQILFEEVKKSWITCAPEVERVSILLYDISTDALFDSKAFNGQFTCPQGSTKHPTSFSLSGLVFQSRKSVYVEDTERSKLIPEWIAKSLSIRCSYGVPLFYKGSVVGVVRFDSLSKPAAFTEFLRKVLDYSVWHLGVLFEKTALSDDTKEFLRRLEVSEQKNRALISALPDTYFVVDRFGTYLDFHSNDENKFAVPPAQFVGKTMREVLGAEETVGFYTELGKLFETGKPQTYEYEYPFDDEIKCFSTRLIPFDDHRCLVIDREITEERKMIEKLQENETRFRSFYEAAPSGIIILDKEGKILQNNRSLEVLLEYERNELTGRYVYELSPPDEVKINFPFFYAVALKDKPFYEFEHKLRTKNNEIVNVLVRLSVLNDSDEETQLIAHISNITNLKKALVEKEHRESFLQLISGLSLKLLMSSDIRRSVREAMEELVRVSMTNVSFLYRYIPGTKQFSYYASSGMYKGAPEQEKQERMTQREILLNRRVKFFNDGEIFRASRRNAIRDIYFYMKSTAVSSMLVVPVFIQEKLWGVIGFEEEHSLRNWIESELSLIQAAAGIIGSAVTMVEAQSAAMQELKRNKFLGDLMRHDITNHNNAVFPVLEMITEDMHPGTDEHLMLLTAYEESRDISRLINNIKIFDEIRPTALSLSYQFPLVSILNASVEEARNSLHFRPLEIVLNDNSNGINLPGNEFLKVVFDNIIRNSIKYSENDSTSIKISLDYESELEMVSLSFADNARGIRETERFKVFSRFTDMDDSFQGSRTGFSLTLCAKIINKLSGSITLGERVKGNFSEGTVVKILLPAKVREG